MKKKVKELEKNGVFHSQWSALMSQTRSKIGLAIVLLFVAAAVFAPLIAPTSGRCFSQTGRPKQHLLVGNRSAGTLYRISFALGRTKFSSLRRDCIGDYTVGWCSHRFDLRLCGWKNRPIFYESD